MKAVPEVKAVASMEAHRGIALISGPSDDTLSTFSQLFSAGGEIIGQNVKFSCLTCSKLKDDSFLDFINSDMFTNIEFLGNNCHRYRHGNNTSLRFHSVYETERY